MFKIIERDKESIGLDLKLNLHMRSLQAIFCIDYNAGTTGL